MSTETFEYKKDKRFAVSQKLRFNDRFKSDFKFMHATREQAETEAIRLAEKYKRHYYVVEIISVVKFKADAQAETQAAGSVSSEETPPPGPPDPPERSIPIFA
jgi:hypothetical protein